MNEDIKRVLDEFRQELLDEFQAYVKLNGDSAKWKLEYYKKHRSKDKIVELFSMPQTFDLASYYAYDNAKDIVEEKYKKIIEKYESTN